MTESPPLRVAFVGAGHMAERHVDALRRVPTPHQVVGVCDLRSDAARALARRAGTQAYSSLTALLEDARPDIVHICTQPGTHFNLARQALLGGAHVYIEKPFAQTRDHAEALFELARERGLLLCAGHQLVRDPAFSKLLQQAAALQPVAVVDSYFAFRPPRLHPYRSAPAALAEQLLDILPHPLYTLVSALEQLVPNGRALQLAHVTASPTDLHATLRIGEATGRLCVSLRARPVASLLTVTGAHGTLTADFVRGTVLGAGNDGTSPLEKIANPFIEAAQLAWRSAGGLTRRLVRGIDYPGLAELVSDFYAAVAAGAQSPIGVDHLRRVTDLYEELTAQVRRGIPPATPKPMAIGGVKADLPVAVVTGAAGFLGRALTRELARRGFRVRGTYRSGQVPDDPYVQEWVRVDLAADIPTEVFAGATVVVHAAAATAGGFDAHARDSVGATGNVLRAMAAAGVRQLVYVSSISVLEPPDSIRERQAEETRLATNSERLGPYTWGKCAAEQLVAEAHARQEVVARIVRPAALIDWEDLVDLPGLLGRRLFGQWYLGLGRPGLPFAACEVGQAGAAIAWIAARFDAAPPVVNLMDPDIATRRGLLEQFQKRGWQGRVVWVPIGMLAGLVTVMGRVMALAGRGSAQRMSVWSILRPRRYDPSVAAGVLAASASTPAPDPAPAPVPLPVPEQSERATVPAGVS
jgi:predicted dehydrogenase/nucleoside-diphosphate-sugar epimerase